MRRFVFAPRWVVGHVLMLVVVASCVFLGRWQWHVSQHTHSLQNLAYALQWPLFAVFFAVMWWRMLRLESRKLNGEFDDEADGETDTAEDVASHASDTPDPAATTDTATTDTATTGASEAQPVSAAQDAVASQRDEDPEDRQLAAYNRMLAELAARDRAAR